MRVFVGNFLRHFGSDSIPLATGEVLECVEDFLVYSVDAELVPQIPTIIKFIDQNLKNFLVQYQFLQQEDQSNLLKCITLLKLLRPGLFSSYIPTIEATLFQYLQSTSGIILQATYVTLFDLFTVCGPSTPSYFTNLIEWGKQYIIHFTPALDENIVKMCIIIVKASRYFLANNATKANILNSYKIYLDLIHACALKLETIEFSEKLASKSLNLIARIIDKSESSLPIEIANSIYTLRPMLPSQFKYASLITSYYMCLTASLKADNQQYTKITMDIILKSIIEDIPLLNLPPYNKSQKAMTILRHLFSSIGNIMDYGEAIISYIYPLISSYKTTTFTLFSCTRLIIQLLARHKQLATPSFITDVLDHYGSALSIFQSELYSPDVDAEQWSQAGIILLKMVYELSGVEGEEGLRSLDYDLITARVAAYRNVVSFACLALDAAGGLAEVPVVGEGKLLSSGTSSPSDIAELLGEAGTALASLVLRLQGPLQSRFLFMALPMLLPRAPHHSPRRALIARLLKKLEHPEFFFLIFFQTASAQFDIFLPDANPPLAGVFGDVFRAFVASPCKQQRMLVLITHDIFRFTLRALSSHAPRLMGILLDVFGELAAQLPSGGEKVRHLEHVFRTAGFGMHSVLAGIASEPRIEWMVATLSLYLFPLCHTGGDDVEAWFALFTPAIENEPEPDRLLSILYNFAGGRIGGWVAGMRKKQTQMRFVAALAGCFARADAADLSYAKVLLNRVCDTAVRLAVLPPQAHRPEPLRAKVDGEVVPADSVFRAIKALENPDEESVLTVCTLFREIVSNLSLGAAATRKEVNEMSDYIGEHRPQFLPSLAHSTGNPLSAAFFCQRSLGECPVIELIADPEDAIRRLEPLCYNAESYAPAVALISKLLDSLPFGKHLINATRALLFSSRYDPNTAMDVLSDHVFSFVPQNEVDLSILSEIGAVCMRHSMSQPSPIQVTANAALRRIARIPGFKMETVEQLQSSLIARIGPEFLTSQAFTLPLYSVIFSLPMNNDKPELAAMRILRLIPTRKLVPISDEVAALFRSTPTRDDTIIGYRAVCFCLKIIANLIAIAPVSTTMSTLWEQLVALLKDSGTRPALPYFCRVMEKLHSRQPIPSMPTNSSALYPSPPQLPSLEDITLITFAVRSGASITAQSLQQWIAAVRNVVSQAIKQQSLFTAHQIMENTIKLIVAVKGVDVTDSIALLVEYNMQLRRVSTIPYIHVTEIANTHPEEMLAAIAKIARHAFSTDLILTSVELFASGSSSFRRACLATLQSHSPTIVEYMKAAPIPFSYFLARALEAAEDALENESEEMIIGGIISMSVHFIQTLPHNTQQLPEFNLSIVLSLVNILFPVSKAALFETDSSLQSLLCGTIIPSFIHNSSLFLNEYSLRRMRAFFDALGEDYAAMLRQCALQAPAVTLHQLLMQMFVSETAVADYRNNVGDPIISLVMLNYNIARFKHDLSSDTPLYIVCPSLHVELVSNGVLGVDSIKSLHRLTKVSELSPSVIVAGKQFLPTSPLILKDVQSFHKAVAKMPDLTEPWLSRFMVVFLQSNIPSSAHQFDKVALQDIARELPTTAKRMNPEAANRIAEMLLQVIIGFINTKKENISITHYLPLALKAVIKMHIDFIDSALLKKLADALQFIRGDSPMSVAKIRFILQLLPMLSRFLYTPGGTFFPQILMPGVFFALQVPKDLTPLYQKALANALNHTGPAFSQQVISSAFGFFRQRVSSVSQPLGTAFATVAQWMWEFESDQKQTAILRALLSAMCPKLELQFLKVVRSLQHPLHPYVARFVGSLIKDSFPIARSILIKDPRTLEFTAARASSLSAECWKTDWFLINGECHITVFARLLLPAAISAVITHLPLRELREIVGVAVASHCTIGFTRFVRFYLAHFPRTSLAECLLSLDSSPGTRMIPHESFGFNYNYMMQRNFTEEALGMTKQEFPSLHLAANFQQLGHFAAARSLYLDSIDSSSYSVGLLGLRICSVNATFKDSDVEGVTNPMSNLPFLKQYSGEPPRGSHLTSFFSTQYLPLLAKTVMFEQVHNGIVLRQHRQTQNTPPKEELAKFWSNTWIPTLDQHNITASSLAWRSIVCREMSNDPSATINFGEIVVANANTRASFIFRAGDFAKGIKEFMRSADSPSARRGLVVTPFTIHRIAPHIGQLIQTQQPGAIKTSFKYLLRLHDYRRAIQRSPQRWATVMTTLIVRSPQCIDFRGFYALLQNEFTKSSDPRRHIHLQMLALAARNTYAAGQPPKEFTEFLTNKKTKLEYNQWMRIFPVLIARHADVPTEFFSILFRQYASQFLLTLTDGVNNGLLSESDSKEIIRRATTGKDAKRISEYESFFRWINRNEESIKQMTKDAHMHVEFGRCCADPNHKPPPGYDSIEQFGEHCAANPPFLKLPSTFEEVDGVFGYAFPTFTNALSIEIDAKGEREARITMTNMHGERSVMSIVSPLLFEFDQRESIFLHALTVQIERHPASPTRTVPTWYPLSYRVHREAVLVANAVATMNEIVGPGSIRALIPRRNRPGYGPGAMHARRERSYDSSGLIRWVQSGAEGSLPDFLFLRSAIVSQLGLLQCLRLIFRRQLPLHSSLLICEDRFRVCLPGFLMLGAKPPRHPVFPLTPAIKRLMPPFVLRGPFTTSFAVAAETMASAEQSLLLYLRALSTYPESDLRRTRSFVPRLSRVGISMTVDSDKSDTSFPVDVIEHIIDTAESTVQAQIQCFMWL